jgi:regulatory protein
MPVITGLSEKPRAAGRYVVLVDGAEMATVSAEIIDRLRLSIGRTIDAKVEQAMLHESTVLETYDRALNLLAFRARSQKELKRRLMQKGGEAPIIDEAIARLDAAGLLNDADYAKQLTRAKGIVGGMSRRRLQQEMAKRGVGREIADDAIAEVMTEEAVDEAAVAEQAARKKLKSLRSADPETRQRRLYGYLARRGYESDDIRRAIQTVLGESEFDEGGG